MLTTASTRKLNVKHFVDEYQMGLKEKEMSLGEWFNFVLVGLFAFFIFLWPLVHVLKSDRSHGGAKFGWFLATFIFSWLAYIVFLIVTQSAADNKLLVEQQKE